MHNNLVLIGFMGSGKSSVGRRLAAKKKWQFLDTDEEIVSVTGKSIRKFFIEEGESAFRDRETAVLRRLIFHEKIVLATGGGIILRKKNCALLHEIGTVIWLFAQPDILFERATRSRTRPLLQGETPRKKFDLLLAEREPLYRKNAHLQIDSSYLNHDETAAKILEMLVENGIDASHKN